MSTATRQRASIQFRARSYTAFVLSPKPPIAVWLTELDDGLHRSAGFFSGRPVVLDLAALALKHSELINLIADLNKRDIRICGIEGADPSILGLGLPPPINGGHSVSRTGANTRSGEKLRPQKKLMERAPRPRSLLLNESVRSGQSVAFVGGDLTVIGSVASGAELLASGSIHIYGTLRGRALAGTGGDTRARIFCTNNEAELVAIDGVYQTADDMASSLRDRPIQVWLEGESLKVSALG